MKVLKGILKFFGFVLALVCAFLIFILSFVYLTLGVSEKLVSKDNINSLIESVDVLSLPLKDVLESDEEITVKEFLYQKGDEIGVSEKVIDNIIEQSDYQEVLSDFISGYASYIIKGDEKPALDSNHLKEIFKNNRSDIEESLGESLTEKEVNDVNSYIDEMITEVNDMIPEVDEEETYTIKYLFMGSTRITILAVIVGLMALIGFFRFNLYSPFKFSSVALFITGLVFSLTYAFKSPLNDLINTNNELVIKLIDVVGNNVFKILLISGLVVIAISIALFVIGILIKKKSIKKDEKVLEL